MPSIIGAPRVAIPRIVTPLTAARHSLHAAAHQQPHEEMTMLKTTLAVLLLAATALPPLPAAAHGNGNGNNANPSRPLVIGHRGASGYLPEHTLEAYALAIELGADYIEPDLVATKDGVLIARHEPNMINTTNVAQLPQFASRRRTMVVDGIPEDGFFASDFTLAEIRTLRAVQPAGEREQAFNGQYRIPTFDEVIELARRKGHEEGRRIGVYPETKHPTYHQQLGLPLEDRLLAVLQRHGWNHRNAPVFIQSFETANLKYLRSRTSVKLVQLVDADDVAADGRITYAPPFDRPYDWTVSGRPGTFGDLVTPAGLAEVRTYADGIGPWKPYVISSACVTTLPNGRCADINGDGLVNDADRKLLPASPVVANAHAAGLLVHPYTFRNEQRRLASDYKGNPINEYLAFYEAGVDGLFTDFTDTAVAARVMFILKRDPGAATCLVNNRWHPTCRGLRWLN
jgi:glycerophosphoryl diester phosphodiesterase